MSSTDCDRAKMHLRAHYPLHHHTVSANSVPTYAKRNIPSYSVAGEEAISEGRSMAAPRYSPNVQPWRRQNTQNSLSFIPSTSPRPEHSEYTTSQTRRPAEQAPIIISPFRSVRRMKQPFQLRLPSSPSFENFENSAPSARDSRRLSRGPSGNNHTLRTWRSDQNLTTTSMETFGLLPSPPLSDSRSSQPSPSSAYFSPKSEYDSDTDQATPKSSSTYKSEAKPSFASRTLKPRRTMENLRTINEPTNVHMAHSNLIRQWEAADAKHTPESPDSERKASPSSSSSPSPSLLLSPTPSTSVESSDSQPSSFSTKTQRNRSRTVSSEGSWVPSSLSYYEPWLQGAPAETADTGEEKPKEFNRRKCQIVPPADKPVVFAVASKTKPKLVDISRQSSPAMSYSIPTPPQRTVPSTPDHRQHEISAFSPDTPLEMSDSGYITQHCYSPQDSRKDKEEDEFTDTSSLSAESINETVVCHKMAPSQEILQPPPKSPPKSPPKPDLKPPSQPLPKAQVSPGRSSNASEKEELEKWWDHEWTIDQLEHSVKDFPRNMLKLTSPVIMFLRHNNEKALIRPFRKIFPDVAENLLDNLCAILIARNYLISLASMNRRNSNFSHKPSLSRLDTVPEKASSMLGVQYSQPTPSRVKNRVLGTRSAELCKDLDRIVDNLVFAICGKQDEHLKSAVLVLAQVLEAKS